MAEPITLKPWMTTAIVHIWPDRDRIEHEIAPSCPCEPELEVVEGNDGRLVYTHHALDGRRN